MGFSVTAANVIFFVALLSAGSVAMSAYWDTTHTMEDARRAQAQRADEIAHSEIEVLDPASYSAGAQRFTFDVENTGSEVLKISEMVYILDGAYVPASTIEEITISGVAVTTDLLLPGETMQVKLLPITASPTYLKVVTGHGTSAYWRS